MPGCAIIARPITALLAQKEELLWTPECTEARTRICGILQKKLQLKVPDATQNFALYLDADDQGISAIMCQNQEGRQVPVAFLSRLLRGGEAEMQEPELWVRAINWALRKFKYYLM